jgi:Leucine rich repeat/Leucine Rich repeats (2 copies)/Leucine Rich repeat
MKKVSTTLLIFLWIIVSAYSSSAQCTESESLLQQGDEHARGHKFQDALNSYQAATVGCSRMLDIANERIYLLVETALSEMSKTDTNVAALAHLRLELKQLAKRKDSLELATAKVRLELENQTNKYMHLDSQYVETKMRWEFLVDSLIRLGPKFTIATGYDKKGRWRYFYVDRNGIPVERLGNWKYATPFNTDGLAQVQFKNRNYLIDTFGKRYQYTLGRSKYRDQAANYSAKDLRKLPDIISSMTQLEILLASKNHIHHIPKWIKNCHRLRYLDLSENDLTDMCNLIHNFALRTLKLNQNHISSVPPQINKLKWLNELDLSFNEISDLPMEIGELRVLHDLNLAFNNIHQLDFEIGGWKQLTRLDLSFNHLKNLPQGIYNLKKLEWLNVTGNEIIDLKDGSFLSHIESLPKLKVLRIGRNPCTDTQAKQAALQLKIHQKLPYCQIIFN